VVEGARLESVCRGNSTVGSNPTLSAIRPRSRVIHRELRRDRLRVVWFARSLSRLRDVREREDDLLAQAEVQAAAAGVRRPAVWLAVGLVLAVHAVGILLWALVHALATVVAL
jgi:hypothetical protein